MTDTNKMTEKSAVDFQLSAMSRLADDFCAVFYVALDGNEGKIFRIDDDFAQLIDASGQDDLNFDKKISYLVQNHLHAQDRTRYQYAMSRDSILNKFKRQSVFFVNYRLIINGQTTHFQNKVVCVNNEVGSRAAIIGIKNIEAEAKVELQRQEQAAIINKLMDSYDCVIHVNMETQTMAYYRMSENMAALINQAQGSRTITEKLKLYADTIVCADDSEQFLQQTHPSVVLEELNTNPAYYVNYRVYNKDHIEYHQMKFMLDTADSTGNSIIIGVHNVDDEYRQNELRYEQAAIISALTNDFDCIAYINMPENSINFYKESTELAGYLPGWSDMSLYNTSMIMFSSLISKEADAHAFLSTTSKDNIVLHCKNGSNIQGKIILNLGGEDVYYEYKLVPDSRKNNCMILGFANTDHKTREELRRHELEALTTARHEFLSRMSHDIRTPINGVIGMLEIAKRAVGDEKKTTEALEKVDTAAHHLFALVDDVLDMTRIESGVAKLKREPMDMRVMINSFMSIAAGQLIGRDLNVIEDFDDIQHPYLLSDELRMRQILLNIMNNAIKFTPDGGTINISCKEQPPENASKNMTCFVFKIADTGQGMSPDFVTHIFEAFSQEEVGARTTYHGTGLGMSITKKYADMFGATIDVESTLDVGSTFTVTFPVEIDVNRASSAIETEINVGEHITTLEGTRIMVVEDNEINMEIAATLLEAEGAIITQAENGQIALDKFNDSEPGSFDAILMDIMMPVMDGLEATRQIRASSHPDAKHIPIVALTANAFDEDRRKVLDAGMNAHLTKPLNIKSLVKTLTYYIMK